MRKLLVTRGHQGSGKSTALRQLGVEGYVLCPDTLRLTLASPVMTPAGSTSISQDHESRVWGMMRSLLDERMARGELIVVDATHRARRDFKPYLERAAQHRYEVACLDFSTQPLEVALARNRQRPAHRIVPTAVIERTWARCREGQVPEGVTRFTWSEDEAGFIEAAREWLSEPILELSDYRAVHHIGDLQGCCSPLLEWLEAEPWSDDAFYILIGDLCDRGVENAEVVRLALEWSTRANVRIHWGNHEDELHLWSRGLEPHTEEFRARTLPQLEAAGITPEVVDELCARFVDATRYTWRGQRVFINHGGLPTVPAHPERVSTRQYSLGTGHYNDPVDARFFERAPEGWVQVHGHRNPKGLPVQASPRSYNLEGQVEHGGFLRILTLDERGFTPREVPCRVFKSLPRRLREDAVRERRLMPPWITPETSDDPPRLAPDALAALREHELINERVAASRPWVSSFNFTRDAFFQRAWDALNVTARGLFVHNRTGEIIARSYDKFFNLGERPETQLDALERDLVFPVDVFLKENGYLGIMGYDAEDGTLFFASKSSPDTTFAGWFRELFEATTTEGDREALRRFLRDTHASMAFEVVDPVRDPHIIEYDAPQVVLLDVIHRHPEFARVPQETLEKIGARFNIPVKHRVARFDRFENLNGWLARAQAPDYLLSGRPVEGFVLEDQRGFLTKIKVDYYNFWKRMRSLKTRVLSTRKKNKPLGRDVSEPRVKAFYEWCARQPDAVLERDIIALRNAFLEGEEFPDLGPPPSTGPSREVLGFLRALENLARLDAIKPRTADNLVAAALASDEKMAALREAPIRVALLLAASDGEDRAEAAELLGVDLDDPPLLEA